MAFPMPGQRGGFLNEDYCLYDSALGTTGAGWQQSRCGWQA
ncbi:Shikimate kinase III [Dickeya solani RNS 08.23.3.1.A]|nr:Shikimate kinase III [Dickeya solani RNS 08.23.3.1.A]